MTSSNPVIAELKACPFCGSAARGKLYVRDGGKVQCTNPDCYASVTQFNPNGAEKAIAAWNSRVSTPPPGIEPEAADRGVSEAFRAIEAWVDAKIGFVNVVPAKRQTYIPLLNWKRDAAIAAIQSLRSEQDHPRG